MASGTLDMTVILRGVYECRWCYGHKVDFTIRVPPLKDVRKTQYHEAECEIVGRECSWVRKDG